MSCMLPLREPRDDRPHEYNAMHLQYLDTPAIWRRRAGCLDVDNARRMTQYRQRVLKHIGVEA